MKNNPYYNVSGQQVTLGRIGVLKIEGNYRSADSVFLQVHDSNTTPANGAVPLKSWPVTGGTNADPAPFFQSFLAAEFKVVNGLYICLSSTDATKTLSANVMDLFVETDGPDPFSGATIAGDLTSAVTRQAIANSAKRIRRVEFLSSDIDIGTQYIMLFQSFAPPTAGDKPVMSWPLAQNTTTPQIKEFGTDGLLLTTSQLAVSATADVFSTAGGNCCLKAIYSPA